MLSTRMGRRGLNLRISRRASRPLRPGMVTSRTTASQSSAATLSMVSCALAASPKVARRNSSARICFRPCRTTAWSSAIRIFIGLGSEVVPAAGQGYPHRDSRAAPGFATDLEFAAEQAGALLHAEQPDGAPVGDLARLNAAAVVLDTQLEPAIALDRADVHA